jgi:hypothetical protein
MMISIPALRYRKRLLWMLLMAVATSVLWVLKVEVAYQHNVRHIPTKFQLRRHVPLTSWKT